MPLQPRHSGKAWIVDEIGRRLAIAKSNLEQLDLCLALRNVASEIGEYGGYGFEGINTCVRALLIDKQREHADVCADVEHAGVVRQFDSMPQIRAPLEDFAVH